MGSGNLLKTIIKIVKDDSSKQVKESSAATKSNGFKRKKHQRKASTKTSFTNGNSNTLGLSIEDLAATRIQTSFRAYRVEWSGGPETMEEVLTKIQQRKEAAVKQERTMAYAFSHQWKAPNSNNNGLGSYELANADWGWSWVECWIAVRPWESRLPTHSITPKKAQNRQISKAGKKSNSSKQKASVSVKPPPLNGKGTMKPRRLSYPGAEKPVACQEITNAEVVNNKKEDIVT